MPFDPSLSVRAARDRYFGLNGFTLDDYHADTFEVDLGEVTGEVWTFRNSVGRRRVVPLHDLHHVVTGYGTDIVGEAEIGAWELMAGCTSLFLWCINLGGVILGFLVAPRRVLRAARGALGQRTLYVAKIPYNDLLQLTVGEVRARLRVPLHGGAEQPPRLHRRAPGQVGHPERALLTLPMRPVLARLITATNRLLGGKAHRIG